LKWSKEVEIAYRGWPETAGRDLLTCLSEAHNGART